MTTHEPTCLLLPGWGTAQDRMHPLRDALAAGGMTARIHCYSTDDALAALGRELARHIAPYAQPVHLVGHSLGGLVCAAAALQDPANVATVTTINSPWRGTWVGWTGPSDLAVELRWRSSALRRLRESLDEHLQADSGPEWTLVGAAGDLATPLTTSLRPGASGKRLSTMTVPVGGHSVSLTKQRMVERVSEAVLARAAMAAEH